MKRIALHAVLVLGVVVTGCAASQPAKYDPRAARTAIASVLPAGWSLEPRKEGRDEFDDGYFRHPHGDSFELVGPQEVFEEWTDHEGNVRRDPWGHESMLVWLVPGDYEPRFPLPFFFYVPPPPERVYWSKGLRVYAATSIAIYPEAEALGWERVRKGWGFGPVPFELSWKTWKEDIARACRDGGGVKKAAANQTAPANRTGLGGPRGHSSKEGQGDIPQYCGRRCVRLFPP